ncbi:hypothetical protein [Leifsonia sp. 1010]|uniref:hypothetical protein n=1 Tax=Leifsonia sp. 1010 TaxID=2817769 RepID=UPI00285EFACC|nr:hypothetical protein [Leifsonia sp. 1010]MDR6613602.1 hypothetical protein [Leifsonia sp. 1010]
MELKDWLTIALGAMTLAWTIIVAVRASREKRYAEQLKSLLDVKRTLESLGIDGLDNAVSEERRQDAQSKQVDGVNVAIRRVSATYVGLVHRAAPSYLAAFVFAVYSVIIFIFGLQLINPGPVSRSQRESDAWAAVVMVSLAVVFAAVATVQWLRARRARVVMRRAGIDLRSPWEKIKSAWQEVAGTTDPADTAPPVQAPPGGVDEL